MSLLFIPLDMDEEGIVNRSSIKSKSLHQGQKLKFIYVIPNFNPVYITMFMLLPACLSWLTSTTSLLLKMIHIIHPGWR